MSSPLPNLVAPSPSAGPAAAAEISAANLGAEAICSSSWPPSKTDFQEVLFLSLSPDLAIRKQREKKKDKFIENKDQQESVKFHSSQLLNSYTFSHAKILKFNSPAFQKMSRKTRQSNINIFSF
jgi:hypothetical protein